MSRVGVYIGYLEDMLRVFENWQTMTHQARIAELDRLHQVAFGVLHPWYYEI